ncbi:hypothetical protein [Bowmanella yangjiangensis]|uniref:Uncharacterized protein n=1 Tax=Bowmanella yangjiangensis TaxID=2811230 RepID=A0ABS3CRJ5_9ALTE|nr:hypothetical protein [Bowmanella yangjiangensis]MBN7819733.1 hypothetical protein [Bowmanella yangjiangensis]
MKKAISTKRFFQDSRVQTIRINKIDVEKHEMSNIFEQLSKKSDTEARCELYAGNMSLDLSDFGEDIDSLTCDYKLTSYIKKLSDLWPYFFHFLSTEDGSLSNYIALVSEKVEVSIKSNEYMTVYFNLNHDAFVHLISSSFSLAEATGLISMDNYVSSLCEKLKVNYPKPYLVKFTENCRTIVERID